MDAQWAFYDSITEAGDHALAKVGEEPDVTLKEIVAEIYQLSMEERQAILEMLLRSLEEPMPPVKREGSSLLRVRGMLKPDGPMPTDEEL